MKNPLVRVFNTGKLIAYGSLLAGIGVGLGAFGAHGLRDVLPSEALNTYETAVRYQMYHSFGLILAGIAGKFWGAERPRAFLAAAWCFGGGVILFCGTLYALSLGAPSWLGAVTPVGGLAFIAGWLTLFVTIMRRCRVQ